MDQDQTPRERALELVRWLLPNWRPSEEQVLWAIRIAVAVAIVLGVLALIGNSFGITLWDWLKVLAVPITVGAAVPWLNSLQKKREQEVEDQRAQDQALQAYFDQMSKLLIKIDRTPRGAKPNNASNPAGVELDNASKAVARTWTLTVLETLDNGHHKRRILRFLYEADLIGKKEEAKKEDGAIVNLSRGNLVDADLSGADLRGVDLSGAELGEANLSGTDLREANLKGVRRRRVTRPKDKKVALEPFTILTNEELAEKDPRLEGATMPDGQKYKDWLKEKEGRGEYLTDRQKAYLAQLKKEENNNGPS